MNLLDGPTPYAQSKGSRLITTLSTCTVELPNRVLLTSLSSSLTIMFAPCCTHAHDPAYKCKITFHNRASKKWSKVCLHIGFPVPRRAWMHSNQASALKCSRSAQIDESPSGEYSHWRPLHRDPEWHSVWSLSPPFSLHVLPWDLLHGENDYLRRKRKDHSYYGGQAETAREKLWDFQP